MNIVGIVGTNSKRSTNRQLLRFIQEHFKGQFDMTLVEIDQLPLFDKPEDRTLPASVQALVDVIDQADGVIISTPEYDHSVPAALANALAWLSYGVYPLLDKPTMVTGASYGVLGSSRAQNHLRQMLNAPELMARVMPGNEFLLGKSLEAFDKEGQMTDSQKVQTLEKIMEDFLLFIQITQQLVHAKAQRQEEVKQFSWDQ